MRIIYSHNHLQHNPPHEIYDGKFESYAEKADRIEAIAEQMRENGYVLEAPLSFHCDYITAMHQKEYVAFLQHRSLDLSSKEILYPSYFIMDTYTPITSGTYSAAVSSVDVALTGAKYLLQGERVVYSLCRPPGHHAEYKAMGGYCYFNNAAIAAQYLSTVGRVGILDIDFHHGNGTQQMFYDRSDILYVSIHANPHEKFPYSSGFKHERGKGDGSGYNINYPLNLGITDDRYLHVLRRALKDVKVFDPDFLILSAGFDTYANDPIGGFCLSIPFYTTIGTAIGQLKLPTLIIQEGGYAVEALGRMAVHLLKGLDE